MAFSAGIDDATVGWSWPLAPDSQKYRRGQFALAVTGSNTRLQIRDTGIRLLVHDAMRAAVRPHRRKLAVDENDSEPDHAYL